MVSSGDPYCYPGTTVIRNLKNIRNAEELAAFEAANVSIRIARLQEEPLRGDFNLHRLLATHRRIFSGVYPWAGNFRQNTGTMTKHRPSGQLVRYGDSNFIHPALAELFEKLRKEDTLRGLPTVSFCERAAFYYGEVDAIHPFREGNSRTLRQFFGDLAREAGHTIDWALVSATEEDRIGMYEARDRAVIHGDSFQLASILRISLRPRQVKDA